LGYGFVEMETEEEAQKAVALLNKKSVDSREINVELAKPREDRPFQERRPPSREIGRGRRGGRGGGRGPRGPGDNGGSPGGSNSNSPAGGSNSNAPGGSSNAGSSPSGGQGNFPRRRFRGGGGGAGGGGFRDEGANNDPSAPPRERRPRNRFGNRPNRDLSNRTPSPTTLFVANLPFSLDDEGLGKLFKDQKVSKSHVVKNRSGRSKGFGFVEFETEADQKAALVAAEKLVVETRELIVKVALTAPPMPKESPKEGGAASAVPAAPASSSAAKDAPAKDTPSAPKSEETKSS